MYYKILITLYYLKELCIILQTAKEVRKYFIKMKKLIKRYSLKNKILGKILKKSIIDY